MFSFFDQKRLSLFQLTCYMFVIALLAVMYNYQTRASQDVYFVTRHFVPYNYQGSSGSIATINITDSPSPRDPDGDFPVVGVFVFDHYGYFECEGRNKMEGMKVLEVLDISNPMHPLYTGSFNNSGKGHVLLMKKGRHYTSVNLFIEKEHVQLQNIAPHPLLTNGPMNQKIPNPLLTVP